MQEAAAHRAPRGYRRHCHPPAVTVTHLPPLCRKTLLTVLLVASAVSAAAYCTVPAVQTAAQSLSVAAAANLRAWPGFVESLSLIFMCELGDKTFFIAALLAMRLGQVVTFLGATVALAGMTVISVLIGVVFAHVPPALQTTVPIGQYVGAALLFYFGAPSLFLTPGSVPPARKTTRTGSAS